MLKHAITLIDHYHVWPPSIYIVRQIDAICVRQWCFHKYVADPFVRATGAVVGCQTDTKI